VLKYINVLLSNQAVSFCNYENLISGNIKWISEKLLKEIIRYCLTQNLPINFIFPQDDIAPELLGLIEKTEHLKITPHKATVNATAVVIESSDFDELNWPDSLNSKIIILKISRADIKNIHQYLEQLSDKFKKITLVLENIESYSEKDIEAYKNELSKSAKCLFQQYKNVKDSIPEINFVSDLWFTKQMNNCNAGIDHYTFAPDGKFYICPAFYHKGGKSIGDLSGIQLDAPRLLSFESAPLCNICDAFHCKRCIYLNYLLTDEYNTPSSQQCRLSHIERECSRELLERLKKSNPLFLQIPSIKTINYCDPMEKNLRNEIDNIRRDL
jgi:CXXX repeat peptide maturase